MEDKRLKKTQTDNSRDRDIGAEREAEHREERQMGEIE